MRHLLLTTLFLSSIALAQQGTTRVDEASLIRDEPGNPILLQTNKLAEPTSGAAQHQQTDLDFLKERAEVSTNTPLSIGKCGGFSCPESGHITVTGANASTAEGIYNGDDTMTIKANGVVVNASAPCYY